MPTSLLFDGCPEPLAVIVGGVIREANAAWKTEFGAASSIAACFALEDQALLRSALAQAVSGRASLVARLAVGPQRGVAMRCTLWAAGEDACCLRLDDVARGAVAIAHEMARNVARTTADDIVHSKEKTLLWIFDQMDAVLWTVLRDGTLALNEGKALGHYGLHPGDYVGSNTFAMYPEGSHTLSTTRRVLAGASSKDWFVEEHVSWLQECHPLRGEDGEVVAQVGLALAMTENVKEMRQAQSLLRVINELPMVVWAMSKDGTCTLSAGNNLHLLNRAPGELVGKNLFEVYKAYPDAIARFHRALAGESFTLEHPVGESVWRSSYHPALDGKGAVTGLFSITEDITLRAQDEKRMRDQLALIQSQKQAIDRLISPIIGVWRGVLVVPLMGDLDAERTSVVTERLLEAVIQQAARFTILDLTGIDMVDSATAQRLFTIMRSVDLLGCTALLSGIGPSVARTMVTLGIEIPGERTHSTLAEALRRCMRREG
ncbi:PAS domain-containing protein [Chondromyces apiculatus]|uniref:STAS domain-containing protein n=1 Tax=Chondromyces apiculatus DSM 436 TaxID=1192034 RepID=A0A017T3I7_9BACT|nr:PAS domain-containing protein [Chondromyces apiculatus]EYF03101.1 Hypothetical protein CAP_6215 [Chondromyces apiculatus DSM 436]